MSDPDSPTVSGLDASRLLSAALASSPETSPAFNWMPPPAAEVAAWFPGYAVERLAGRGAMGAVYRAVQQKLERPVAIKILPAELAARDGVEARFQREARALARLNHPGIVALHDFGRTEGGHLFIVMEYVDGTDLSRLIHAEGGGLSVPHALEIVGQVCDALQYAHSRGFVHRDIKPGNVLVDKDGRVKIADFGLAKLMEESADASQTSDAAGPAAPHSPLTHTGQALGTPDYTAPEQLKGGPVDHRADIYSLGVMFYEMLTGNLPRGAWAPPSQRAAAPARLDEVVTRAMQTEPDKRYQQASEVKAAAAAGAQPVSSEKGWRVIPAYWRRLTPRARAAVVWWILLVAGLAGLAACYYVGAFRNSPAETRFIEIMTAVSGVGTVLAGFSLIRLQQASEVKAAATASDPPEATQPNPVSVNRVMFWLMIACIIASAFIAPTSDALTMLMLAAPFIALAAYFTFKRRPAGLVALLFAGGMVGALAGIAMYRSYIQSPKHRQFISEFQDPAMRDQSVASVAARIIETEAKLSRLLVDYGEKHPQVLATQAELAALRRGQTVQSGVAPAASSAALSKMQEVCAHYDKCLVSLSGNLERNSMLDPSEIASLDRDAVRLEGMCREALALGMDASHPLAVEARRRLDEIARLFAEWKEKSVESQAMLEKQLPEQTTIVETARAEMLKIAKEHQIVDQGIPTYPPSSATPPTNEEAARAMEAYTRAKTSYQIELQYLQKLQDAKSFGRIIEPRKSSR